MWLEQGFDVLRHDEQQGGEGPDEEGVDKGGHVRLLWLEIKRPPFDGGRSERVPVTSSGACQVKPSSYLTRLRL